MDVKNLINTIAKKEEKLRNYGFKKKDEIDFYCLLPKDMYRLLIEYLFNQHGRKHVLNNKTHPSIQFYGFYLVSSDVTEPMFVGDI